jgi:hypothetical protein
MRTYLVRLTLIIKPRQPSEWYLSPLVQKSATRMDYQITQQAWGWLDKANVGITLVGIYRNATG